MDASLESSTQRTYATGCVRFMQFLRLFRGVNFTPLSFGATSGSDHSDVVHTAFLAWLCEVEHLAPTTCRAYVMAVRSTFQYDHPHIRLYEWKTSQARRAHLGAAKSYTALRSRGSASPMTLPIVMKLSAWAGSTSSSCSWSALERACFIVAITWGYATGMRVSELLDTVTVGRAYGISEVTGELLPVLVALSRGHQGPWLLHLDHSKTDRFHVGSFRVIPWIPGCIYCPSAAFISMWEWKLSVFPDPTSPVWGSQSLLLWKDPATPYDSDIFRLQLTEALTACEIPGAAHFTPHSMRIGCAALLTSLGYSLPVIERLLGWKSEPRLATVLHYSPPSLSVILLLQRELFVQRANASVFLPIPGSRQALELLRATPSYHSVLPPMDMDQYFAELSDSD